MAVKKNTVFSLTSWPSLSREPTLLVCKYVHCVEYVVHYEGLVLLLLLLFFPGVYGA